MARIREFSEEDEDHFELEDTQNEIEMEDSITIQKPNRNCCTNGSSSGNCLSQTRSKSDALKFKLITLAIAISSRSIYIWVPQMGNYRYKKTNLKYIIDPPSDSNKQFRSIGK
jgi:ankyrin repeat protein